MAVKHTLFRVGAHTALRALCATGTYQPVVVGERTISKGRRGTEERLQALLPVLGDAGVSTVADHGCAEGYIVRRVAERGSFALGVDDNVRALTTAQLSLTLDGVQGWAVSRLRINADTVAMLPETDATISLSVMHHVMIEHGVEHASKLLRLIHARTRKVLIFEMGQSDEHAFEWASQLPDMGADPHRWIADWVSSCGFSGVEPICEMRSYNSDVRRATFAAYPAE